MRILCAVAGLTLIGVWILPRFHPGHRDKNTFSIRADITAGILSPQYLEGDIRIGSMVQHLKLDQDNPRDLITFVVPGEGPFHYSIDSIEKDDSINDLTKHRRAIDEGVIDVAAGKMFDLKYQLISDVEYKLSIIDAPK